MEDDHITGHEVGDHGIRHRRVIRRRHRQHQEVRLLAGLVGRDDPKTVGHRVVPVRGPRVQPHPDIHA
jgi:hypothetical protein